MYKQNKTKMLLSILLSISGACNHAYGFDSIFEEMENQFRRMSRSFRGMYQDLARTKPYTLSPENQAELNEAIAQATSIRPEISKTESGVITIAFPIENIDKEKIEIAIENGILIGLIPIKLGFFRFYIRPRFIESEYVIDFKQEIKSEQSQEGKGFPVTSYNSLRESDYFASNLPLEVDLTKVSSETKNNKLFIRLQPKNYARLKIKHN